MLGLYILVRVRHGHIPYLGNYIEDRLGSYMYIRGLLDKLDTYAVWQYN